MKHELLFDGAPDEFGSFEDVFKLYKDGMMVPEKREALRRKRSSPRCVWMREQ